MVRLTRWWLGLAIAAALVSLLGPARAADEAGASLAAARDGGGSDASEERGPGELGSDRQKAADIEALIAGTLGVTVSPESLFEAPPDDAPASALAAARLRALLRGARELAATPVDAGPDAAVDVTGIVATEAWQGRLAVDRARAAFYALPSARRRELLGEHARRVAEAKPKETDEERRTREAEGERLQALQAAKDARTEAARVVAEEHARLLKLEQDLEATKRRFESDEKAITSRKDAVLGWQRRAREARTSGVPIETDAAYDALRRTLLSTRDALDAELDGIDAPSVVPQLGPDPLMEISAQINAEAPRSKRRALEATVGDLVQIEGRLRVARVEQLLEETDTLNRDRLSLIASLSSNKRREVTGFTVTGWDQAQAELRHLTLIVRYHRFVATRWLSSLRQPGGALGSTIGRALAVIVPWALLLAAFVWWRRRGGPVLEAVQTRLVDNDRAARLAKPSYPLRGFRFLRAVHGPLEWLALFLTMMWLLPAEAQAILEVQLITVVVGWTLAGAFAVDVIDAAVATSETPSLVIGSSAPAPADSSQLRLRSLRLVGRVVVTIILILVISARLVGEGAIYSWVLSTCWLAAFPITLVLVRWWRETIFARIERVRRKSGFQTWALANRTGWTSFISATSAGVHLFVTGAIRFVRNWLGGFDLVRRGAAYLFRRELAKLDMEGTTKHLAPLARAAYDALAPAEPMERWVATEVDAKIDAVLKAMEEGRGGVFALVGERGAGKSAVFDRLQQRASSAIRAQCEGIDLTSLRAKLAEAAALAPGAPLESFGDAVDAKAAPRAVLLDDAHAFVRMVMGGLADFDALMAIARAHSKHAVWIVSLDDTVWQFLQRARGVRPLFDDVLNLEPWSEERIAELIELRTEQAGLTPTFEDLLEQLPSNADEIDKQDALRERKVGYYRLIWDHALGNPGVALHVWRGSVGLDEDGVARVRHLQVPVATELEALPYPTLFILRAVLQLAPASADELTRATQLTATEISDALRYSLAHGYLVERDDGRLVDVSWTWLRSITRLLQRRHLLVLR